jgi:hypothetical protein
MGKADKLRHQAVKLMMKKTGDRLIENCHWCNRLMIWWQKLPQESIINKNKHGNFKFYVNFQFNKKNITLPVVTVDHVNEIIKGGHNNLDNLVLSCQKCNCKRSNPPKKTYAICIQCIEPKLLSPQKRCQKCKEQNSLLYGRGGRLCTLNSLPV